VVRVQEKSRSFGLMSTAYPNFLDWASQNKVFESEAAGRPDSFTLAGSGAPERLQGMRVSHDVFATLGVHAARGRDFLSEDDRRGAGPTVILSDGLWKRCFAGDSAVIGQSIRLDGVRYTVVGVMPPEFQVPVVASDVLVPLGPDVDMDRSNHYLEAMARLKPGVTVAQAVVESEFDRSPARAAVSRI
jgi:hypothetical protein